jgi:DNA (cytosine-5)-methyltransferase 1
MGAGKTVDAWDAWTERMQAEHGNGNGHGKSLAIEAQRMFRTPTAQLAVNGGSQHPDKRKDGGHGPTLADEVEHLLPTPRATDGTKGGPNQRGSSGDLMLPSAVQKMLPTPTVMDYKASGGGYNGQTNVTLTDATVRQAQDWCEYEAAIRRQEHAFGRPAPLPTEPGKNGQPRLSPAFVEWLMALPEGHVTGVPGISRNEALKALGNGVCPPQAAAATRAFVHDITNANRSVA